MRISVDTRAGPLTAAPIISLQPLVIHAKIMRDSEIPRSDSRASFTWFLDEQTAYPWPWRSKARFAHFDPPVSCFSACLSNRTRAHNRESPASQGRLRPPSQRAGVPRGPSGSGARHSVSVKDLKLSVLDELRNVGFREARRCCSGGANRLLCRPRATLHRSHEVSSAALRQRRRTLDDRFRSLLMHHVQPSVPRQHRDLGAPLSRAVPTAQIPDPVLSLRQPRRDHRLSRVVHASGLCDGRLAQARQRGGFAFHLSAG